ncbi:hypothetical protein J6590_043080 [Homalodisca vitripennis]|nr:hypothetical protein J6590_043080 [Homalodisca vitripennis]
MVPSDALVVCRLRGRVAIVLRGLELHNFVDGLRPSAGQISQSQVKQSTGSYLIYAEVDRHSAVCHAPTFPMTDGRTCIARIFTNNVPGIVNQLARLSRLVEFSHTSPRRFVVPRS